MLISIAEAVKYLKNEEVVAIPTETVYGLAALATSEKAVKKVFEIKKRPADNPLICHFYSLEQIGKYIPKLNQNSKKILKKFSPGPVSILLKLPGNSSLKPATRGQNSVICRIPNHPKTLDLLKKINIPIAAPSANTSGKTSATNAKMVELDLGQKISGVLDGGQSNIGLESTIIDCREDHCIKILRPGAIGKTEMENLGIQVCQTANNRKSQTTPGAKYPHYSPNKPVYKINSIKDIAKEEQVAIFLSDEDYQKIDKTDQDKNIFYFNIGSLDSLGDVAKNLYKNLTRVNSLDVKKAYFIEYDWGESSLAEAIKNRLNKVFKN